MQLRLRVLHRRGYWRQGIPAMKLVPDYNRLRIRIKWTPKRAYPFVRIIRRSVPTLIGQYLSFVRQLFFVCWVMKSISH